MLSEPLGGYIHLHSIFRPCALRYMIYIYWFKTRCSVFFSCSIIFLWIFKLALNALKRLGWEDTERPRWVQHTACNTSSLTCRLAARNQEYNTKKSRLKSKAEFLVISKFSDHFSFLVHFVIISHAVNINVGLKDYTLYLLYRAFPDTEKTWPK